MGDDEGLLSWFRLVAQHDPKNGGKETSLLLKAIAGSFRGAKQGSLEDYEVTRESSRMIDLGRHMRNARLTTYPIVREKTLSIIVGRDGLSGSTATDVSAVHEDVLKHEDME